MRKSGLLLCLAIGIVCVAPVSAQVIFQNIDGQLSSNGNNTIGSTTLSLAGSTLTQVTGLTAYGISNLPGSNLGSLTFTTGALASGSITGGGSFSLGGSFTIVYQNGTIFHGSFVAPAPGQAAATWSNTGGGLFYNFVGTVNGTLTVPGYAPASVTGASIQLSNVPANLTQTSSGYTLADSGGTTSFGLPAGGLTPNPSPVPEPGTLTLLGSGLVTLGVFARRLRTKSTGSVR